MISARDKALLDVVAKIPPTWTCVKCGREYDNSPDGEMPYAREVGYDAKTRRQFVRGEICQSCCQSGETS